MRISVNIDRPSSYFWFDLVWFGVFENNVFENNNNNNENGDMK